MTDPPSNLRLPARSGWAVDLTVDWSTGLVSVRDPAGGVTWAQAGTVPWALRCAAKAVEEPTRFVRHHLAPARCIECDGHGVLWGQTYGSAALSVREIEVQRCDACQALDSDEAAARTGALLLHTSYRYAPPAGGAEPGDEDDPPGDWVVELTAGFVALREEDGDAALLDAIRTAVRGAADRG